MGERLQRLINPRLFTDDPQRFLNLVHQNASEAMPQVRFYDTTAVQFNISKNRKREKVDGWEVAINVGAYWFVKKFWFNLEQIDPALRNKFLEKCRAAPYSRN